jgi:hypothetical protein
MRRLPLLLLLAACGRNLDDGDYLARVTVVGLDTCLDPQELHADDRFPLHMDVSGDTVFITSTAPQLHGAGNGPDPTSTSHPRPAFIGRFLYGAQDEVFIADTNFEVVKTIANPDLGPVSCDSLAHLAITRGVVESSRHFRGQLRKTYEPRVDAAPACIRSCVVELEFDATLVP